ncbi:hypothetical protein DNTS_022121 [Danionella cerebrum]|uniref:Uncharacterized protein n=1 Tax=Danionella cerebrum TaxID=2873325 RepID=A0A553R0L0_9TELE|nr:hypothetical protein DNTS_022121 [Danionella translucida]
MMMMLAHGLQPGTLEEINKDTNTEVVVGVGWCIHIIGGGCRQQEQTRALVPLASSHRLLIPDSTGSVWINQATGEQLCLHEPCGAFIWNPSPPGGFCNRHPLFGNRIFESGKGFLGTEEFVKLAGIDESSLRRLVNREFVPFVQVHNPPGGSLSLQKLHRIRALRTDIRLSVVTSRTPEIGKSSSPLVEFSVPMLVERRIVLSQAAILEGTFDGVLLSTFAILQKSDFSFRTRGCDFFPATLELLQEFLIFERPGTLYLGQLGKEAFSFSFYCLVFLNPDHFFVDDPLNRLLLGQGLDPYSKDSQLFVQPLDFPDNLRTPLLLHHLSRNLLHLDLRFLSTQSFHIHHDQGNLILEASATFTNLKKLIPQAPQLQLSLRINPVDLMNNLVELDPGFDGFHLSEADPKRGELLD